LKANIDSQPLHTPTSKFESVDKRFQSAEKKHKQEMSKVRDYMSEVKNLIKSQPDIEKIENEVKFKLNKQVKELFDKFLKNKLINIKQELEILSSRADSNIREMQNKINSQQNHLSRIEDSIRDRAKSLELRKEERNSI
jgi:ATP-dependent Lon protease